MPIINGLEWTFDTVASSYDKMRPGYVDEVYKCILEYHPIDASGIAAEVGIGAGQATMPILRTGCKLVAVEPGEHFSELCREKFMEYPQFTVITGKFEEVSLAENAYDLVYSATAFHWVPEEIGYPKVFKMLKGGGAFARFANQPYPDRKRPGLTEEIDDLYERYYYRYHNRKRAVLEQCDDKLALQRAKIAEKYGFEDIRFHLFHRERIFSAEEYVALLGTYSDHIAIEEGVRMEFFSKIKGAIQRHGGFIAVNDTIDLELARKPGMC